MQYLTPQVDDPEIRHLKNINNQRLRNAFEDIIQKYAKDFTQLGDEIDLDTGEIVIDNGHIERMRNEQDTGDRRRSLIGNLLNQAHMPGGASSTYGISTLYRQTATYHETEDDEWEDIDDTVPATHLQSYSPRSARRTDRMETPDAVDDLVSSEEDDMDPVINGDTPRNSSRQNSGYPEQRLSRSDDIPSHPNRTNSRPFMGRPFGSGPASGPAIDREMVREFAQDIASQITEFIYFFAGSIQRNSSVASNQRYSNYSNPRAHDSHFDEEDPAYNDRPLKRRRTVDESQEYLDSPDMNSEPVSSRARDKRPINRVAALRSENGTSPLRTKHGHRGLTPGMPSLWSGEEDSDYAPQRRTRRKQAPKPKETDSGKAKAKPQNSSRLRNEVRNTSEPPTSSHDKIQDRAKAASSPATKQMPSSAKRPSNRQSRKANSKDAGIAGNDELDLLPIGDEEPITIRDTEDEYELEADIKPMAGAEDEFGHESEDEAMPEVGDDIPIDPQLELGEEEHPTAMLDEDEVSENDSAFSDKHVKRHYHPRIEFTEEHDRLIEELRNGGMTWPQIAEYVPHTENQIYYRWKRYISKGNKEQRYRRLSGKALDYKLQKRQLEMGSSKALHKRHRGNSEEYDPSDEDAGGDPFARNRFGDDQYDYGLRNGAFPIHNDAMVQSSSGVSLLSLLKVTPTAITSGFRSNQTQKRPLKIIQAVPDAQRRNIPGTKFNHYQPPKPNDPNGDSQTAETPHDSTA
jgi:Centromere protein Scm3/Myb-like DNA-binding domain